MKKQIAIFLTVIFVSIALFALSGCGISRFYAYDYENGIMLLLDGDETNFYAEFDFITTWDISETKADEVDAYLLNILKSQYGDLIEGQERNYYQEENLDGTKTGKTIFYYYYVRPITDEDTEYYRYDPKLIKLTSASENKGLYYNKYSVQYADPFTNSDVDTPFFVPLQTILSGEFSHYFADTHKVMLACGRRDMAYNGEVKAVELQYYTEVDSNNIGFGAIIGYSFSRMVSWSWYLTVILITGIVIGLILLIAKKRDGRIVAVKPKATRRRPPYGYPPYGQNPYNQNPYGGQNPYGNPYNNPNNQNPFGGQYNNQQPPYGNQQNPYGAPPQYPQYGNQQYPPYGNPQQYPPQPPKPDDVFPGFGSPGEDEKK